MNAFTLQPDRYHWHRDARGAIRRAVRGVAINSRLIINGEIIVERKHQTAFYVRSLRDGQFRKVSQTGRNFHPVERKSYGAVTTVIEETAALVCAWLGAA